MCEGVVDGVRVWESLCRWVGEFASILRPRLLRVNVGAQPSTHRPPFAPQHKKHIDAVLSQLREEMELLADFERMQDRLTKERVRTWEML